MDPSRPSPPCLKNRISGRKQKKPETPFTGTSGFNRRMRSENERRYDTLIVTDTTS
jgi:hypothetical protein